MSDALAVVLPVASVAGIVFPAHVLPYLALVPSSTLLRQHYFWNVATHLLIEPNVLLLAASVAAITTWMKECEAQWGTRATLIPLLVAALASAAFVIVWTALDTGLHGTAAIHHHFEGFLPGFVAVLVMQWNRCGRDDSSAAASGATGDEIEPPSPSVVTSSVGIQQQAALRTAGGGLSVSWSGLRATVVRISRAQWVGLACLVCVAFHVLVGHDALTPEEAEAGFLARGSRTLPSVASAFAVWFYLRFVKSVAVAGDADTDVAGNTAAGSRPAAARSLAGDPSPHFAFEMIFPDPLRPAAALLGRMVFPLVRLVGLGGRVADLASSVALLRRQDQMLFNSVVTGPRGAGGGGGASSFAGAASIVIDPTATSSAAMRPLPGTSAAEAERRRQIALAALTQRLERARLAEAATASPVAGSALTKKGSPTEPTAASTTTASAVEISLDM